MIKFFIGFWGLFLANVLYIIVMYRNQKHGLKWNCSFYGWTIFPDLKKLRGIMKSRNHEGYFLCFVLLELIIISVSIYMLFSGIFNEGGF